jgi:uncharacterized repeat protein (TIGR01451 family)
MPHMPTCSASARGHMSHASWPALLCVIAAALLGSAALAARADAEALIDNGTIGLGVGDRGHLIVPGVPPPMPGMATAFGLRYLPTDGEGLGTDALANQYEGWGAADVTSGITGFTSTSHPGYNGGVQPISFTSTATSAIAVVDVVGASLSDPPTLRVTHDFHPSPDTPNLYEVDVTIKNVSAQTVNPRYRRALNWSVSPTRHNEFVTIGGTPVAELLFSSNCGYHPPDPLVPNTHCGGVPFFTGFFTDVGPTDEGALFDFGFAALAPNDSMTFHLYFGAASSEDDAEAAVADVNADVWSFGQPNTPDGPTLGTPNTFIFAFKATGASPVANDLVLHQVALATIDGPDQLNVRAELKNTGTHDATNVETEIVLPAGLSLVSGPAQHAFNTILLPGQQVDHTWSVSAPGACLDVTYQVTINATFSDPAGGSPFTRTRSRDLLVRGTCAQTAGNVNDRNSGAPISGAYVYACPQAGGSCSTVMTGAGGSYAITGLAPGTYTLSVMGPGAYVPDSRTIVLAARAHATESFGLSDLHGPPAGTAVSPSNGTNADGVPRLARVPTTVSGSGCAGATASFTVKMMGSIVVASGPMAEGPAGTYTSAPFGPFSDILTITTVIACPDGSTQTTVFNAIYIDPSGTVRTTDGDAIAGATVTLLRADAASGPFAKVPDGDAIMSPGNRKNSDLTDAVGHFGWDVIPGYYKVRASKSGCTAVDGGEAVDSGVMEIPPPVTDLDLRLRCPKAPSPEQPGPGGSPQPPAPGNSPKPLAVSVRIARRGPKLVVSLRCPKRASSACTVSAALKLTKPSGRGTRVVTLVTRRAVVAAGKTAKLTVRRLRIETSRKRLRLHVRTKTSAGTRAASYAIPR